uniref:RNA-directed DNA polymerase, eukaryota, reverse transcriptase zinc-binding domain protein n=1 Tax=Tanacetum cinerariifolium TaxID=118510 RepID=A0A699S2W5_TANCI|nr:hypothetical protein [Tanacetum cinerariifolium]
MIAVTETRLIKKIVKPIWDSIFGHWPYFTNSVDSKKGCRIVIGWNQDVIDANLISASDQIMHFKEKRNQNIKGNKKNKKMKTNEAMDDEVGDDLSAHDSFMTHNVVSNTINAFMVDMVNNDDAGISPSF